MSDESPAGSDGDREPDTEFGAESDAELDAAADRVPTDDAPVAAEPTTPLSTLERDLGLDRHRDHDRDDRRSLAELAATIDDRASESAPVSSDDGTESESESKADDSPELSFDGHFERERLEGIDEEALWEQVRGGTDAPIGDGTAGSERKREPESELESEPDRTIRDVSKRSYCHRCEFFAEPPIVGCTNDGTDILEMPTLETFRVADCPRVEAEDALDDERGSS